ncbi:MAG: RtcB family protein [Phycisphaeraceae bacterium]|nr:RtcB family protein [Phycisphaeraceae bacterium]
MVQQSNSSQPVRHPRPAQHTLSTAGAGSTLKAHQLAECCRAKMLLMITPYRQWGIDLDPQSVRQMEIACALPVTVRGALMPDAHVGYGLPIGGVLATQNAVIPYAVGVDIACRVKLSVFDIPVEKLASKQDLFRGAIERETRFGIGAQFTKQQREHAVMDHDWSVSPITRRNKDKAHAQLGSSGSGTHFVEFGILTPGSVGSVVLGLEPDKTYLALLSHSGSRGTGAQVCDHYSKLAMSKHPELSNEARHLAWLDMDGAEGQEYWAAMNLMGEYASANHACIHEAIARHLGATVLVSVENHHNFAWRERHAGRDVIVHRKGATPADAGALGVIPGSMASPCYVVRGRGDEGSLRSAAHGAGRVMSRRQAKRTFRWQQVQPLLQQRGVTLLSAGLDEVPQVYKDIDAVMAAQGDLVEAIARFDPRLVKMAPAGERAED